MSLLLAMRRGEVRRAGSRTFALPGEQEEGMGAWNATDDAAAESRYPSTRRGAERRGLRPDRWAVRLAGSGTRPTRLHPSVAADFVGPRRSPAPRRPFGRIYRGAERHRGEKPRINTVHSPRAPRCDHARWHGGPPSSNSGGPPELNNSTCAAVGQRSRRQDAQPSSSHCLVRSLAQPEFSVAELLFEGNRLRWLWYGGG